jgi:chemotaxis signal transduction protein
VTERNKHHVSKSELYLEFKVGPLHFCVPVHEVEAIRSPAEIKLIPVSETMMACSFNHEGRTVTMIDMHSKFGLPFSVNKNRTHIILATVENKLKGFWVDRAINVVPLSSFEKDKSTPRPLICAFFSFLLRDQEVVLQTSFHRLCKCQGSDLNWIAGDKAKEEAPPDERVEPVTNKKSDSSTSEGVTRAEKISRLPKPKSPSASSKNKKNKNKKNRRKASAANKKTTDERRKNKPAAVISLAAISARANSKNRQKPDIAVPADSVTIAPMARIYNNQVVSISAHRNKIVNRTKYLFDNKLNNKLESKLRNLPNNKPESKKNALLFLVMILLVIVALGWGIGYLMSVNTSGRIEKAGSGLSGAGLAIYVSTLLPFESEKFSEISKAE